MLKEDCCVSTDKYKKEYIYLWNVYQRDIFIHNYLC